MTRPRHGGSRSLVAVAVLGSLTLTMCARDRLVVGTNDTDGRVCVKFDGRVWHSRGTLVAPASPQLPIPGSFVTSSADSGEFVETSTGRAVVMQTSGPTETEAGVGFGCEIR